MKHFRLEDGGGEFVDPSIIAFQIGTRQSWIKVSAAGDHEVRRIRVLLLLHLEKLKTGSNWKGRKPGPNGAADPAVHWKKRVK